MPGKTLMAYITLSPCEDRTGKPCLFISIGKTQDQLSPWAWKNTLFEYVKWRNTLQCSFGKTPGGTVY